MIVLSPPPRSTSQAQCSAAQGPPEATDASDANDSGRVDVSDGVWIVRWLFAGAPPPPPPGPIVCGADPTPDGLGPCVVSSCE